MRRRGIGGDVPVLQLLPGEDEERLVCRNPFLVLDLCVTAVTVVRRHDHKHIQDVDHVVRH